jgi:isocitrate dehydrogenase
MLEYMGWKEAAALITQAMGESFLNGKATHDLARFMPNGTPLGTTQFGEHLVKLI